MAIKLNQFKLGVAGLSSPTPHFHFIDSFNLPKFYSPYGIDWGRNMPGWPLLGNDTHNDCTVASLFHFLEAVGSFGNFGTGRSGTTEECLGNYSNYFGYNPNDPSTDLGGVADLAISKWLEQGLLIDGQLDKPLAAFKADPQSISRVENALAAFGPLPVVAALPQSIEGQNVWGLGVTDKSQEPGSYGLHQMLLLGIVPGPVDYYLKFATWGQTVLVTQDWWRTYVRECWAIIHPLWLNSGHTLTGFDYQGLTDAANTLYLTKQS